jgi:hypothetical protein
MMLAAGISERRPNNKGECGCQSQVCWFSSFHLSCEDVPLEDSYKFLTTLGKVAKRA